MTRLVQLIDELLFVIRFSQQGLEVHSPHIDDAVELVLVRQVLEDFLQLGELLAFERLVERGDVPGPLAAVPVDSPVEDAQERPRAVGPRGWIRPIHVVNLWAQVLWHTGKVNHNLHLRLVDQVVEDLLTPDCVDRHTADHSVANIIVHGDSILV